MNLPVNLVIWLPCWRIIPSRFPPIELFECVVDPADLEAIYELESLTNDRLREEVGELQLVPSQDRATSLTRDTLVSIMYSEELNSGKRSVTLQRTDRHGILGQKPFDFQCAL
jgi:hypothetical protein